MQYHPYRDLPAYTRWSKGVAQIAASELNPAVNFPFKIGVDHLIATAGSCFAQHIARHMSADGFNFFVTEPGHPIGSLEDRKAFNYGVFSARYGNIYTARQLVQLFERAYGRFIPADDYWVENGRFIDPLRPTIQPNGFSTLDELTLDRQQHLTAVRSLFENCDYFIFTLGLTECWMDRRDGAVYPVCPGVSGGVFDPDIHMFHNFSLDEVVADFKSFVSELRNVNSKVRIILTVSPVPLAATAVDRHVLVSTTYSKSVLRVAAEQIASCYDDVAYFPSYEIITGNYNKGAYYVSDLREISEEGVNHVMKVFKAVATDGQTRVVLENATDTDDFTEKMREAAQVVCDEQLIELSMAAQDGKP